MPTTDHSIETIRARALLLLTRREHSVHELRQKLIQKQFCPTQIDQVLPELVALGLLSDTRFTEMYLSQRARKGYGPVRIAMELRARGVADEIISEQMLVMTIEWQPYLQNFFIKKFKSNSCSTLEAAKQKHFLHQRGFTHDQIKELFYNLLSE